jgi:hypothetical protein
MQIMIHYLWVIQPRCKNLKNNVRMKWLHQLYNKRRCLCMWLWQPQLIRLKRQELEILAAVLGWLWDVPCWILSKSVAILQSALQRAHLSGCHLRMFQIHGMNSQ